MAISSLSLSWVSTTLSQKLNIPVSNETLPRVTAFSGNNSVSCTTEATFNEERNCKRRLLLLGVGALTTSLLPTNSLFAEEIPKNYTSFVDFEDGYSYHYPSDWIDFDFTGHDSAFKDKTRQLQNVKSYLPFGEAQKTVDGKNYYSFEYELTSPNYSKRIICNHSYC